MIDISKDEAKLLFNFLKMLCKKDVFKEEYTAKTDERTFIISENDIYKLFNINPDDITSNDDRDMLFTNLVQLFTFDISVMDENGRKNGWTITNIVSCALYNPYDKNITISFRDLDDLVCKL